MGGLMAQYSYPKHPERLGKLVLGNTFPPYKKENGGLRKHLPYIPEGYIMRDFCNNVFKKVTLFFKNSRLMEAYLLEQ